MGLPSVDVFPHERRATSYGCGILRREQVPREAIACRRSLSMASALIEDAGPRKEVMDGS